MPDDTDYLKYRGKCKEMAEALVAQDPTLRLVRGFYYDSCWGEQPHWWCMKPDGTIVDPTALQFPTKGKGTYVEFDGTVECAQCGKEVLEKNAEIADNGRYAFCSHRCYGLFIGVY